MGSDAHRRFSPTVQQEDADRVGPKCHDIGKLDPFF